MNKHSKWIFLLMSMGMLALVIVTSMKSNMFQLPQPVLDEPWFWTTLADFYNNIALICVWVAYKENNVLRSGLWILSFIILGSIATPFYVFRQITKLQNGEGIEAVLLRRRTA